MSDLTYRIERHFWRGDIEEWDWKTVGYESELAAAKAVARSIKQPDAARIYQTRRPDLKTHFEDEDTGMQWESDGDKGWLRF